MKKTLINNFIFSNSNLLTCIECFDFSEIKDKLERYRVMKKFSLEKFIELKLDNDSLYIDSMNEQVTLIRDLNESAISIIIGFNNSSLQITKILPLNCDRLMNFVLEILCWIFIFIILSFLAYAWDKQENKRK